MSRLRQEIDFIDDPGTRIIVVDIKLSPGTQLTANQEIARLKQKLRVKTVRPNLTDIKGRPVPTNFAPGVEITQTKFLEIHGNGNGMYQPGGLVK